VFFILPAVFSIQNGFNQGDSVVPLRMAFSDSDTNFKVQNMKGNYSLM